MGVWTGRQAPPCAPSSIAKDIFEVEKAEKEDDEEEETDSEDSEEELEEGGQEVGEKVGVQIDFEVERIVYRRVRKVTGFKREYKIRWKGYGKAADRWILASETNCPVKTRKYDERRARRESGRQNVRVMEGGQERRQIGSLAAGAGGGVGGRGKKPGVGEGVAVRGRPREGVAHAEVSGSDASAGHVEGSDTAEDPPKKRVKRGKK